MNLEKIKSKKLDALFSGILIVSGILLVMAAQLNWFEKKGI